MIPDFTVRECCRTKLSAVENRGHYTNSLDNQLRSSRGFQPRSAKIEFYNTLEKQY